MIESNSIEKYQNKFDIHSYIHIIRFFMKIVLVYSKGPMDILPNPHFANGYYLTDWS